MLALLSQVLEIHAHIRPDLFISGTTKHDAAELAEIFQNEKTPVYVYVDEQNAVRGFLFCIIKEPQSPNLQPIKILFIDDICIDENCRGQGIGERLFVFAKELAKKLGCYEVALNVWEGNDNAIQNKKKMGMKPKETEMEIVL